jgi:hypothetical protein
MFRGVLWGFFVAAVVVSLGSTSHAESASSDDGRPALTGEVAYSEPDTKNKTPSLVGYDNAVAWANALSKIVSSDGKGAVPELEGVGSTYLSVLYLHCVSRAGTCPFILDSILEADVIASRESGSRRCPLMKSFWKNWLALQLEERGKFLVSVATGLQMAAFNSNERPRYVDCKPTVEAILDDKESLATRYGPETSTSKSVTQLVALLKEVKEGRIDIFASTGVKLSHGDKQ